MSETKQTDIQPGGAPPEEVLPEKKWSVQQRWAGIFTAPRATMENIARKPVIEEAAFVVLLQVIMGCIALGIAFGKMSFTGTYASSVRSYLTQTIALSIVFTVFLTFLFWAIRAKIILALCKGDSAWDFKSAAAVTGYALIPGILLSVITTIVVAIVVPSVVVDTTSVATAQATLAAYTQQVNALKYSMTVPVTIVSIALQAYLGAHGVKAGTKGACSFGTGFAVFFGIGLIDLLLLFL